MAHKPSSGVSKDDTRVRSNVQMLDIPQQLALQQQLKLSSLDVYVHEVDLAESARGNQAKMQ